MILSISSLFSSRLFFLLGNLLLLIQLSAFAQDNNDEAPEEDEITVSEIINIEMRLLRAELKQLQEDQNELIIAQSDRTIDRIAALDQRLLTLENRLNSIYREMDQLDNNFSIAIAVMVAIALLTVISVFVLRKRMIDPIALQTAQIKADLESDKGANLKRVLQDMARDDPYIAQLLKKHKLD